MVSKSSSATARRCRLAATVVVILMTSGCNMLTPASKRVSVPDFSKAKDPLAVERLVPPARKMAYSNLFGCTIALAQKRGLPTPPIDEKYATAVARQVMIDPKADETCYARMRAEAAKSDEPRTSWDSTKKQ